MNAVEQRVLTALRDGDGASHWESLMVLINADREAFYLLACDGVRPEASARVVELADLARRIREAVRGSYQVETSDEGAHLVGPRVERTFIPPNLAHKVADFLRSVDGKGIKDVPGKDYEGTIVSEAEVRFQLGDRSTWETERKALTNRKEKKPRVLRIDSEDLLHLANQPGYVTFGLKECARRIVLAPSQVFRDLKRGDRCPDNLRGALAFCGKPRRAVNNDGQTIPAPEGMIYAVYADADGFIFDWDWVEENPSEPGCPINPEIRFGDPIELTEDVTFEIPVGLPIPQFDWTQACYSPKGDCIFCYITDDVSFASRINSDLTVFRSLNNRKVITGFKIKNVCRILEEDRDIVLDDDPDLVVSVQSALLATLKGHSEAPVSIYEVFIKAFKTQPEPPKVRVPKRPMRAHAEVY